MTLRLAFLVAVVAAQMSAPAAGSAQEAVPPSTPAAVEPVQPLPVPAFATPRSEPATQASTDPSFEPARDPRIRLRPYSADTVFRLVGHTGYQIMVQLEPEDRVQTVGIGDAAGWQITPNEARNLLFLKPTRVSSRTNMSIVTDRRTYNFELVAVDGTNARTSDLTYVLRFQYPKAVSATARAEAELPVLGAGPFNRAYSFEGSDVNVPAQVFDDGKATYLRFAEGAPMPAILVEEPGAGESIVNVAHRGPYTVIDRVAAVFVLKQGREVTRLYNDGFVAPALGDEAPLRRPNRKRSKRS